MNNYFLSQNGHDIFAGRPDYFGSLFDWCFTVSGMHKKCEIPKTIYLKTDFLPHFVDNILPTIENEFVLITACSDYSPEVIFNREYNILINHPNVKYWFMNNMRTKTEKSFALPAGLGSRHLGPGDGPDYLGDVDGKLLEIRDRVLNSEKLNKVFCGWKHRGSSVAGDDMILRPALSEFVKKHPDRFDVYEETTPFYEFVEKMSSYKYVLCPGGNAPDPTPNAWFALMMGCIPIVWRVDNNVSIFDDVDSVIFFKEFEELLDDNFYVEKEKIEIDFLTNERWANKIKSKIKYQFIKSEPHKHTLTEFDSMEMYRIMVNNGFSFLEYGSTDKLIAHSYTGVYEKYMSPKRYEKNRLLEIGAYYGGSILLWHDYLPNTTSDFCDINDYRVEVSKNKDRTNYFLFDAYNSESLSFFKDFNPEGYDFIIDDGPHTLESQIFCIQHYSDFLKTGGVMFIEDIQDISHFDIFIEILNKKESTFEIEKCDLRGYKNRYDDLMLVVKKLS